MGPYLNKATETIKNIMDEISARAIARKIKRRFGFVGYRDHNDEFVTRVKNFCKYSEL